MASPLLRINVNSSKALQATILALKGMPAELSKQTRAAVKSFSDTEWREAVRGNVTTALETRVLSDTARVAVTNQNVTLKSATVGKSLSGGYKPSQLARTTEFGATQDATATYTATSRKGKSYTVRNRHTHRQFKPVSRSGYAVYAAAARIIPRIAAAYVQTTVRTLHEAFEKGATK
jgi:hypothetical protein